MSQSGRQHGRGRYREASSDPARSQTPRAYRTFLDGNREIHCSAARDGSAVRVGKAMSRTPTMDEQGKSDGCMVPEKLPNEAEKKVEEAQQPVSGKRGVGVYRANEAIDALKRIPLDDPLRKRGFQIVSDWIKINK